jgi:EAL domain-containing protein (putative c-di-GMP-specific phosphodiesterase class I)/AmiR/NasT family two-component response regulator
MVRMSLSALRVMVVEDHGFQRRLALRLLAELGISTTMEAADGAAALAELEAVVVPPDVILVDLDMPGMDGIEFIGHVAQRHLARGVALVSALDPALLNTVQMMARAYGLHVLGIIEKPLSAEKLEAVLTRYEERLQANPVDEAIFVEVGDLRRALQTGEILPWFQPQAEFANGKIVGIEALARWQRGDGQVIRPHHFVGKLEAEGLATDLTDAILDQACAWKRRWQDDGLRLNLSVNVSPATLHDTAAADRYQQIVESHGVSPSEVILEITESLLMADAARGLGVRARLRLKGFGLSIDDFGTGYSSLAQLSQVPFTELKIDQGFVFGAHAQPRKRAVVEASLDLARKLQLETVAEGVETVEDWQMLAELGCGIAQGYLVGAPVAAEDLADCVARWRAPH